jgi:hypothetical protein
VLFCRSNHVPVEGDRITDVRIGEVFFLVSWGGAYWPIVPALDDRWWWMWSSRWNENWHGKQKYSEKTRLSATLSTTNPTWPGLGSNSGCRSGEPATNRLSYYTAIGGGDTNSHEILRRHSGATSGQPKRQWNRLGGGVTSFECHKWKELPRNSDLRWRMATMNFLQPTQLQCGFWNTLLRHVECKEIRNISNYI